jgi:nucleotide-binding universal stress UspA family protein
MTRFDQILIPTDFSTAAQSAVYFSVSLLEQQESPSITFLFNSNDPLNAEQKEKCESEFRSLRQKFPSETSIKYNYLIKTGNLIENIVTAQKEINAKLIVMGTKGSYDSEDDATSNTSQLILEADCPIIAIPDEYRDFKIENIALALDNKRLDESDPLTILHNIARKYNSSIHVLTIDNDDNPIVDAEQHANTLEYYFETLRYHHKFPKNADIEEGINNYEE